MSLSAQRAVLFIDNGYLSAILRDEYDEPRINYLTLSQKICNGYYRLRTYMYDALPYQGSPPTREQRELLAGRQKFFYALSRLPSFEVRLGRQRPRPGGYIQKGVDVLLAIDMIRLSSKQQIQKAFLIGGDADYVPVVKASKDEGVSVTLYYSGALQTTPEGLKLRKYSDELWTACDERVEITPELINKCRMN